MHTKNWVINKNQIKEKSMSNELMVKKDINQQHELSIIEQVVMQGDLSKLNPEQRVTYYHKVCDSVGLNPFTRPFDYISLNGKLTLYAKKDATEQLRKVNNISITELEGKLVDDLYIVTAKARTPGGRIDQATAAVSIGNLKGDQKANAIMKAETKAKRRVTLSISGMGWTDESEIETIPNASTIDVDISTGEIKSEVKKIECCISKEKANELQTILDQCDPSYKQKLMENMKKGGVDSLSNLTQAPYEKILKLALKNKDEYQTALLEKENITSMDELVEAIEV